VTQRHRYIVNDRNAATVCAAVFEVVGADATHARIDTYSDFHEQMPADIRAAQAWLRERGLGADNDRPGESVAVARTEPIGWAIVEAYAPWSTRTTLHDATGVNRATIEDGGHAVTVDLTTHEVAALHELLTVDATIDRVVN
jgi:hypothetical protein